MRRNSLPLPFIPPSPPSIPSLPPSFQARNYVDHQLYVLKAIPFDGASQQDAEAALREANVLALLRHPHVVPYKEFFHSGGDLCLVMALCEGGDLYQHTKPVRKGGPLVEEDKIWDWLVQLLLALSYCHSKKILHRDVKTQNIFLTQEGKLMLGDFGLAKQLQRTMEMAKTPIGTPYYM
jgi:serine/threonine protein kinase